jgi:hypothetical protein
MNKECGTNKSVETDGHNHWYKYEDPVTHEKGHLCKRCHDKYKRKRKRKGVWFPIPVDRVCMKCGTNKSISRSGYGKWYKYENGYMCTRYGDKAKYVEDISGMRAYYLAYSKLPKTRQRINKHLREITFFETDLDWGYKAQQEFRKRVAKVLSEKLSTSS